MDYVVGFMREALSDRVMMVRKAKPIWQAGLLNGVGGKVDHKVTIKPSGPEELGYSQDTERLETPLEAMVREFFEETGIDTNPNEWRLVLYMNDPRDFYTGKEGGTVYWFAATRRFLPKLPARVLDSGEELLTVRIPDLGARTDVLASPKWVIPMAFGDATLAPLGSDDAVRSQAAMARGEYVRTPPPKVVDDGVLKLRGMLRKTIADSVAYNRSKVKGIWPMPPDQLSPDDKTRVFARVMAKRGASPDIIRAVTGLDAKGDGSPVGCKLKFVHREGAPLCECADVCMGNGMSSANLNLALGLTDRYPVNGTEIRKRPAAAPHFASPQAVRVGEFVRNRSGTEGGKVLAVDGPMAWVQSNGNPNKRVSLYTGDLIPDPLLGGKVKAPSINGERLVDVARPSTGRLPPDQPVHPINLILQHLHKGRSAADAASGPAGSRRPIMRFASGAPVNTRSIGADGYDRVVPGEPLERPDAEWTKDHPNHTGTILDKCANGGIVMNQIRDHAGLPPMERPDGDWIDGAGAEAHFGASRLDPRRYGRNLPRMQEQPKRDGFEGGARSGELGFDG